MAIRRKNPEHIGEKIAAAIRHLREIAADARDQADEIDRLWSASDWEGLAAIDIISSRDLAALQEERDYLYGRNNPAPRKNTARRR